MWRSFDPFSPFFLLACRKDLGYFDHSDDLELPKLSNHTLLHSAHGVCGLTAAECCSHGMDCQTCSLRTTKLLLGFVLFEKWCNSISSGTELEDQHWMDHLMLLWHMLAASLLLMLKYILLNCKIILSVTSPSHRSSWLDSKAQHEAIHMEASSVIPGLGVFLVLLLKPPFLSWTCYPER